MTGKWYKLLALLLILSLALVACDGAAEEPPAGDTGEEPGAGDMAEEPVEEPPAEDDVVEEPPVDEEPAEEAPEGVTELHLMGWSSSEAENTRLQSVVDDFNADNENIQVTLNLVPDYDTRLQTSLAGGSPPDVFYIDSFRLPDYVDAGAVEAGEGRIDNPDDFYDSLYNAFVYDGTFYCPPKDFSTLGLIYNEDLFEAAGVDTPTEDWTWDDLQSAAEQLTNADEGLYGMSLSADFARLIAFLYQAGGEVANEDFTEMTINSPEALEATEFYVGLVADGYAAQPADLDSGWPGEAFGREQAAMVVEGNWIVPFMEDQFPDVNYGIAQLPAGPGGEATMAFTVCYGVPADIPEERQAAAFELVNYLTGEEGMEAWTDLGLAMPTRESLRDQWLEQFPELQPFLDGADHARAWQFVPGFQDVLDTINDGLQQAFAGAMLPEQVLEEAEQVGNEVLNR